MTVGGSGKVGFVVFNTTGNGQMNVNVVVKGGAASTAFSVSVVVNLVSTSVGTMTTDAKGSGQLHTKVALPAGATVTASVNLTTATLTYATGDATVPVKTKGRK